MVGRESKLAESFYEAIAENCHVEKNTQLTRRVKTIFNLLHCHRKGRLAKSQIVIPWMDWVNAFTITGEYIYVAKSLAHQLTTNDQLAFVLAHEIGHIDLGHTTKAAKIPILNRLAVTGLVEMGFRNRFRRYSKECDADDYAIELCERSGFDRKTALTFFDRIAEYALQRGGTDMVYGTWASLEEEWDGMSDLKTRRRQARERRKLGYPSLVKRKARLLDRCHGATPLSTSA